jgi:hypothetical protein
MRTRKRLPKWHEPVELSPAAVEVLGVSIDKAAERAGRRRAKVIQKRQMTRADWKRQRKLRAAK